MIFPSRPLLAATVVLMAFTPQLSLAEDLQKDAELRKENALLRKQIESLQKQLDAGTKGNRSGGHDETITAISEQQVAINNQLVAKIGELKKKLDGTNVELGQFKSDVSGADQKKLETYLQTGDILNRKLIALLETLQANAKSPTKGNDSSVATETVKTQLPGLEQEISQLAATPQEFKIFTRLTFKAINAAKDFQVTLTAESAGKKIPLSNRPVRMSRQFLDGDPKPLETLTTDENGQVIISRNGWRSVPQGHNLRFDFDGDKQNRKSFYKSSYR